MKSKTAVASAVVCVIALWATWEYSHAAGTSQTPGMNVGVVSIRSVISGSQHQVKYRSAIMAQQAQLQAQLQSLDKSIDAAEAELNTLRPGTEDYFQQYQVVLDKRSELQNQQEYLTQKRTLEDKEWMEKLYQTTLQVISDLAEERGLDMVLEKTDPQFPMLSRDEVMAIISTHKVLYSGNCVDLTEETIKRLDAKELLTP